jgi:hypothetical protein
MGDLTEGRSEGKVDGDKPGQPRREDAGKEDDKRTGVGTPPSPIGNGQQGRDQIIDE